MKREIVRKRFLESHQSLPPHQVVALIGSHRRVEWPSMCAACAMPATTRIKVAKIFGRRSQYGHHAYYRFIVRMPVPFCHGCAERHRQMVKPMPSVIGSFFRTPAVLSFIGATAVAVILSRIFLQGGEGVSAGARLYALSGIAALIALGIWITAREARFLRVPPLTEITSACDFSDNVGVFGVRRFYAIRNPAFAEAFKRANQHRLWTDEIRKRDEWMATVVVGLLIAAALIAWLVRD